MYMYTFLYVDCKYTYLPYMYNRSTFMYPICTIEVHFTLYTLYYVYTVYNSLYVHFKYTSIYVHYKFTSLYIYSSICALSNIKV